MRARLSANRWVATAATLTGFGALTALMMWPLPARLASHVIKAIYYWDAYTNTMAMSSRLRNLLGTGPGSHYTSYFFAPIHDSIVFNESLFGLSLIYAPFELITGEPLLAYNLTLLISLTLSQFFTFLLVRRLTGSAWAAALVGFVFAFSPYATFEMGRIQLVATQWIPLCFLFAHRAAMEHRQRDVVGLLVSYLLQIGTCMYYAMFMLPLLAVFAAVHLWRRPPPVRFWLRAAACGVVAAGIGLAMTYPYFTSRDAFKLERAEDFAASFDGELTFFANVHDTNRTLTSMHHRTYEVGAHEEIAFPSFTVAALCLLALLAPLWDALRERGPRPLTAWAAWTIGAVLLALLSSGLSHSMLTGAAVLSGALLWFQRSSARSPYPPVLRLHIWLLAVSVVLFLGMFPFAWQGEPVKGLYYYLHTYVPGFNGIRKVSRQACMTTFTLVVLAGFGGRTLFFAARHTWARAATLAVLLAVAAYELRTFPNELDPLWHGATVPAAYRYIADQPGDAPIAVSPAYFGRRRFRGHRGMAIHNYMALFHRRRTLNGKSSFIPAGTHLVHQALRALPKPEAIRVLQILKPEFLLLHTEDMHSVRARAVLEGLDRASTQFQRVFEDGPMYVYRMLPQVDETLGLLPTPTPPAGTERYRPSQDRVRASVMGRRATPQLAVDGDLETHWYTARNMRRGDWFELELDRPRTVHMIELNNAQQLTDHPQSFKLSVEDEDGRLREVYRRPVVKLFSAQVYRPQGFVFRIPLPRPTRTRRVRITVMQPMPARWWTIDEASLYVTE